jgi:hypothetical protein
MLGEVKMPLEQMMKEGYKSMETPKGMFTVWVWDPSNPEKSIPKQVGKPYYTLEGRAIEYARRMNEKPQPDIGESDYFVMNDKGLRVY